MVEEGLAHFVKLRSRFVRLDSFTYSIIVPCCDMVLGQQVHADVVKIYSVSDVFLGTNFIRVFAGVGEMDAAMKVFDEMPKRDLVAWNALISWYSKAGMVFEAVQLHSVVICREWKTASWYGLETDVVVGSVMLDMHSKCGQMEDAITIFRMMPEKDSISWNEIICGYAQNGEAAKALMLFDEMVHLESPTVSPNVVTFIGFLSACSQNGLLKEAYGYFNDMIHKYVIEPKLEHYTLLHAVDRTAPNKKPTEGHFRQCAQISNHLARTSKVPNQKAAWMIQELQNNVRRRIE
ncbi:hypothetical protein FNV43_RR04737 [Rhamnella rubrinervis]|uniref:Pentatricopeptide repeat-containing protein n=1 Tax=Rhamnella rubrinervis TaxID=2594499 RepID=A0A8K0HMD0_9ROSA|nr:hypothetical protein FNV43_RR04737 [Rhamnella rubrinervis]